MLLRKEAEEGSLQYVICYVLVLLLLIYFIRFVKGMSNINSEKDGCTSAVPVGGSPSQQNVAPRSRTRGDSSRSNNYISNSNNRRRRWGNQYTPEEWIPRNLANNLDDYSDQLKRSFVANTLTVRVINNGYKKNSKKV